MEKHRRNFRMCYNSIENRQTGCLLEEPAVIMCKETGSPRKIGNYTSLEKYFEEKLHNNAEDYELIKFNMAYPELGFAPEGYNFTPSEICTLLNWVSECCIGAEAWNEFKAMPLEEMKVKLSKLEDMFVQLEGEKHD